jgi:polyisoprenoid-binding protein YceI
VAVKSALLFLLPLLLLPLAATVAAQTRAVDPAHTRIGFTLKTRWGQVLQGRFPRYSGEIETLDDGRRRVRLRMSAREVEIVGHPNYTGMTRGRGFFEADRFPEVVFVSDPYPLELLAEGGRLGGELSIRDVRRRETFVIEPGECERPAQDCDVIANGSVRRSDYGVDRWIFAVSDAVRFTLRLRVEGE